MEINRAALGALAVVGIVAAGVGGYVANREIEMQPMALTEAVPPAIAGSVNETENTITTTPVAQEPEAADRVAPPTPAGSANDVRSARPASRPRPAPQAAERNRPVYSAPPAQATSPSVPADQPVMAAIEPLGSTTVETVPVVPAAPQKFYEELVVPADSVIGLQVETAATSDSARVEDSVRARVTRDVKVHDYVAIPAGARAEGSITLVERGGRLKDQARLGIRFHTIVLADGTRLQINTETIYRDGESPAKESAAKIGGGAVGGAVLGAILGGKKGAIIGSTVGAGAGGAAVAVSDPNPATLAAGSTVTVRMSSPATVTVEK
jgi:type IV secretory pathway VirB10-like protein